MIVGAGLAGLIAAHAFPALPVVERAGAPSSAHRALLRFRGPQVGELTGVPFHAVRVRKGIWSRGAWTVPTIQVANAYARKVLGRVEPRSIWDIEPATRYIAPDNFHARLLEQVGARVTWGERADFEGASTRVGLISTAPLPVAMAAVGMDASGMSFDRAPISVLRYRVDACNVHQTVYFPDSETLLYRASITGDVLICEFAASMPPTRTPHDLSGESWADELLTAFALSPSQLRGEGEAARQRYGKISPVEPLPRQAAISELTRQHNVYSLGRFATWRNILLDDVVHDITVIKRLVAAAPYARSLAAARV